MSTLTITSAALSDVGLKRADNQDSYLAQSGVYLVADGMGGGVSGRAASSTTLTVMSKIAGMGSRSRSIIEDCLAEAQNDVLELGAKKNAIAGTTVTGIISRTAPEDVAADASPSAEAPLPEALEPTLPTATGGTVDDDPDAGNAWYVVNIGDSRTYHLNRGTNGLLDSASLVQVSHDHSKRQEAIDSGAMEPELADKLIPRNIITQAIGSPDGIRPDFFRADLPGRFIICSDGVYSELTEQQFLEIASANTSADATAHAFIDAALAAGGHDNATVIVVDVTDAANISAEQAAAVESANASAAPLSSVNAPAAEPWAFYKLGEGEDLDDDEDATLQSLPKVSL